MQWRNTLPKKTWLRFFKDERVLKELNEVAPIVDRLLTTLTSMAPNVEQNGKVTILDLCSGFGFLSMLLSEMLSPDEVDSIILVDKRCTYRAGTGERSLQRRATLFNATFQFLNFIFPTFFFLSSFFRSAQLLHLGPQRGETRKDSTQQSTEHVTQREWPIPLFTRKVNIKKSREQKQLTEYVFARVRCTAPQCYHPPPPRAHAIPRAVLSCDVLPAPSHVYAHPLTGIQTRGVVLKPDSCTLLKFNSIV